MMSEIGKEVKMIQLDREFLISVRFDKQVKIYSVKKNKKEILPCCTIRGEFLSMHWEEKKPWLYLSNGKETFMYT